MPELRIDFFDASIFKGAVSDVGKDGEDDERTWLTVTIDCHTVSVWRRVKSRATLQSLLQGLHPVARPSFIDLGVGMIFASTCRWPWTLRGVTWVG